MKMNKVQALLSTILFLSAVAATGQELTPRAYWPAPKGTRLAILGYTYSSGDVVTDPSLPVVGVDSRINMGLLAYLQTLSLWGRTANILVELPYSQGVTKGQLEGDARRRDFSGFGDFAVTLYVNLLGAPSMTAAEFQELRRNPHPILGGSIKVVAPTGEYDADKLINVGAHRWAVRGELGYMLPLKPKWLLEFDLGLWGIGDNDEFLGVTREQDPIVSAQTHLVKRFKPGFWAALDLNYYIGVSAELSEALQVDASECTR
jgi:hypothetical protein